MIDDQTLIHQCGCILLNNPKPEDLCWVSEALKILANAASLSAQCYAIDDEYQSLVNDH